jgi:hypothetical protein
MLSKQVKQRRAVNRAIRQMSGNKHCRLTIKRHKRNGATFIPDGPFLRIFSYDLHSVDLLDGED